MLIGSLLPTDKRTIELEGEDLADIAAKARAAAPAGWQVTSVPVRMRKGSTILDATSTIERRDESREIEADDMPTLQAKVPEGWTLASVRRV